MQLLCAPLVGENCIGTVERIKSDGFAIVVGRPAVDERRGELFGPVRKREVPNCSGFGATEAVCVVEAWVVR